jgi:hypothetical protein
MKRESPGAAFIFKSITADGNAPGENWAMTIQNGKRKGGA